MIRQINQMLEQEGILPKGKRLDDVAVFRNEGMTNLLFFFGEEKPDIGKLAVWRLKTHLQFGGTWMSDYVNNRLGGFLHEVVAEKPDCALIGESGNIFNLMGIAARTLRENGMEDKAEEMKKRITGGEEIYEMVIREMTETAVRERNEQSPEEQELQDRVARLSKEMQEKIKDLPEDVKKAITDYVEATLLAADHDCLYLYEQGAKDCVALLKKLGVL